MKSSLYSRIIYPALHALRGDLPYGKLKFLQDSQWLSPQELADLQSRKLADILAVASGLPFYRSRFEQSGLDWRRIKSVDDLSRLPILEKRELADGIASGAFGKTSGFIRETTGTTGIPLRIVYDKQTSAWSHAARLRSYGWYGVRSGEHEARFWGRPLSGSFLRSTLRNKVLNRTLFSSRDFRSEAVADTLARYAQCAPDYVYGYASLLIDFGALLRSSGSKIIENHVPKVVVSTAEQSLATERGELSRVFHCPVVSEYGCSEVDIIAFECPEGAMHIMSENLIVEAVADPGSEGYAGAVITDLNNRTMPLLRYRLGDFIELSGQPCSCGRGLPVISNVLGRSNKQFVFLPSGEKKHACIFAYAFESVMSQGYRIEAFHITQTSRDTIRIDAQVDESFDREGYERAMGGILASLAGEGMTIVWNYPDVIRRGYDEKYSHFHALEQ